MIRANINFMLLLLSLLAIAPYSHAELFKWVDENGNIFYSDKNPGDRVESKVIPKIDASTGAYQQTTTSGLRPIIRPYDTTTRKLHVLDTRYLWKSESQINQTKKIGVYYTGKGCISHAAILSPDVFIHHKSLFPAEWELAQKISQTINQLDYPAERTKQPNLLSQLKNSGGLSLHAEIVAMNIDTCAPRIGKNKRNLSIEKIPASRFTKNRIRLKIGWQLRTNRDQDVIYKTVTTGVHNGWNLSMPPKRAVGKALESAVFALFSEKRFIDKILVVPDDVRASQNPVADQAPIVPYLKPRIRKLLLTINPRDWLTKLNNQAPIGHLRVGETCTTKTPLPLKIALSRQQWLSLDAHKFRAVIVNKTQSMGYAINPTGADTFAMPGNSDYYSLNAKLFQLTYDGCAPSLSGPSNFKAIENFSFGKLSRHRLQVWIEWTLTSDAKQKLLYQNHTVGFAGSLEADTNGAEAMDAAIGMAAEQLFADGKFVKLLTVNQPVMPRAIEFNGEANNMKALHGIVKPADLAMENLIIVANRTPWAGLVEQKSIGFYAYGVNCTPYEERSWPPTLPNYPKLFPHSAQIVATATKVATSLGYEALVGDQFDNAKHKLGSYRLQAEITELRYDSCAPDLDQEMILSKRKLTVNEFKRHRVNLSINWTLVSTKEQEILFKKSTVGIADSWLIDNSAKNVFARALTDATTQLFADKNFIVSFAQPQPGLLTDFLAFFDSDDAADSGTGTRVTNIFHRQAQLAQVLSDISELKTASVHYYMMHAEWPDNPAAMGYSEPLFNDSDTISNVDLQPDGSIVVELKELFGKDKTLMLQPKSSTGELNNNRWQCSSNLDRALLPANCVAW